jgi:hypothetical protein
VNRNIYGCSTTRDVLRGVSRPRTTTGQKRRGASPKLENTLASRSTFSSNHNFL